MKFTKNLFAKVAMLVATVVVAIAIYGFASPKRDFEFVKYLSIFQSIFTELDAYYVDEIDVKKSAEAGINAMLASLDPYTNYIREEDMDDFKFMTTGEYGGVGSIISMSDTCYIMIREIYQNLPADKAGLLPGDYIVNINGKDAKGMTVKNVSDELRGTPNTIAKLKVWRKGTPKLLDFDVTRQKIQISPVPYYGMLDDEIGYIVLTSFTENCAQEVMKAFLDLKNKHNAKKMIFDLRDNPGGLLDEALSIVNMFVPKGSSILSTKGRDKSFDKVMKSYNTPVDTEMPMVVLISRGSASASEIVAGALQDLDRAVIMGERSFGKGLVQGTREIGYNNALKLTTAKYYTPSGRCIQALDYSHRDADGAVGYVPDSLISEFKTKNGRTVFDGGGISPDIMEKRVRTNNIMAAVVLNDIVFHYAVDYRIKHKSIPMGKAFKLTDADYEAFCAYVKTFKDFSYKSYTNERFKQLVTAAKEDNYYNDNKALFDQMEKQLAPNLDKDLRTSRELIQPVLEYTIARSYHYEAGRIMKALEYDEWVKDAVSTLNDTARYNGLLDGSVPSHAGDKRMVNKE